MHRETPMRNHTRERWISVVQINGPEPITLSFIGLANRKHPVTEMKKAATRDRIKNRNTSAVAGSSHYPRARFPAAAFLMKRIELRNLLIR
jgi:hypothetical protein